jgi:uncharacterized protein (TIGR02588 family)
VNEDARNRSTTSKRHARRRVAEWVSLGVSVLLIGALSAYLVYQGVSSRSPFVPVEVRIELDRSVQRAGRYVVPVTVKNLGDHTLRDLRVTIEHRRAGGGGGGGGDRESQDFDIDYLGERAEQRIFIYLDEDPRTLTIEARAVQYRLD